MRVVKREIFIPDRVDAARVVAEHKVAAVSEGQCPYHQARLTPIDTPEGVGGVCPTGEVWCVSGDTISWWVDVYWMTRG